MQRQVYRFCATNTGLHLSVLPAARCTHLVVDVPGLGQGERHPVADQERTDRQRIHLCSAIGPSTPNANPQNQKKVPTMAETQTAKKIVLARYVSMRRVKMKWSSRKAQRMTENHSVGTARR
jgi:hypothetical protein